MSLSIRNNLHGSFSEAWASDITFGSNDYYYFLGGTTNWGINNLPPDYVGSEQETFDTLNDVVLVKKILASDVSYGTARHNWISGTVYTQYDSKTNISTSNFYVLTSDFNVYKCLSNNSGGASTVMPTGTSYTTSSYSDGYSWKYLYTIPLILRNKFLNDEIMPVFRSLSNNFYGNGGLRSVGINSGGTGYLSSSVVTLTVVSATGSGAVIYPIIDSTGSITKIYIASVGSGYLQSNTTITVSGNVGATGKYPSHSTALFTPNILSGVLDSVSIIDPGLNYTRNTNTTITVAGDGTGAKLTPFVLGGVVVDVAVESAGSGYSYATLTVVSAINGSTGLPYGTGAALVANLSKGNLTSIQSIVEQTAIDGAIHGIKITAAGTAYSVPPIISITGDGFSATATARVMNGSLVGIDMTNIGFGYTTANVTITPVTGTNTSGAAYAIISPQGGHGKNAVEELYANKLILTSNINNESVQGIAVQNSFRQYGIVKNPLYYQSLVQYDKQLGSTCFNITVNDVTNITVGSTVYINNSKPFLVIYVSGINVLLKPTNYSDNVIVNDNGRTASNTFFNVLTVMNPDINRNSLKLQYVNNQASIDYTLQQQLTLKTIFTL